HPSRRGDRRREPRGRRPSGPRPRPLRPRLVVLLAIPNVSEGRDERAIEAIGAAFDARLLGIHSDPDHHRSVFTLAGTPGSLAGAVLSGAAEVVRQIDLERHEGIHPRVGAIDVAPVVYLDP